MSSQSRILALDIGASKLTLAEFSIGKGSAGPVLLNYSSAPRPSAESAGTFADLAPVVQSLMTDMGVRPAPLVVLLPGQSVFPRFFKLATAAADMVDQMVQEEAAQNLPFNLDQIVWDYEKLRENEAGELEALIVATKVETAEDVASLANALALPLERVEAGPLALYNAVHAQVADLEGCTLVLDMGSKTTDLLFVEGGKVFMRTIPVAGGAITNEIVRSTGASFEDAEAYKIESGYVALGGTYGNPDDEQAEHVSKIIRNVVTRLHAEVTRSINFYRSQQGGSAPSRILLTGGSALLRYLDTFFREKLGVDVFLFNPFDGNSIAPQLGENTQAWGALASLTGVALSHSGKGVLSINLVPPAIIAEQRLTRRIPFFIAGAVCFIAAMVCWLLFAAAEQPHDVQQLFGVQVIADDLTLFTDVDHVKRVNAVTVVDINAVVDVPQHKDDPGRSLFCLRDNRMQPLGGCFNLFMMLDIFQQVEAELIQPQIHDGDAAAHILNVHHFLLQTLELRPAVFEVSFFFGVNEIIISGRGHDGDFHAGFHTGFQIDVLIQIHIRPEVDQLDTVIFTADTVDSPEPLNDADRVPVDVVVDEIVAVLQVLTFGNTVGGNQSIKLILASGY